MPRAKTTMPAILALLATLLLPLAVAAFEVGHREISWSDPARGNRQVAGFLFYPAISGGANVPVAPAPMEGFPVVVLGHGFLMSSQLYGYVPEAFVPAGYVVVMPETETGLLPDHQELGRDLVFLVSRLQELGQDEASPYFEKISTRSAALGHSMGGGAALLAAAEDPGITTVIGLAPAETNPSAIAACAHIDQPALIVSGSVDCVAPAADHQIPMFQALDSDCRALINMIGGSHCQFAASSAACNLGEGLAGCADPTLSRAGQQELVVAMLHPWLDATLKDDPGAWNRFLVAVEEAVELEGEVVCAPLSSTPPSPMAVAHLEAFPNPFNPGTTVRFELAASAVVNLEIHDMQGRLVRRLITSSLSAGAHEIFWDGKNMAGKRMGSGLYFLRLQAGNTIRQAKLTLVK